MNKHWRGILLVLMGMVFGAAAVFVITLRQQPDENEIREMIARDTIDYIKQEQRRVGYDCHNLRKDFLDFLDKDIKSALKLHQSDQKDRVYFGVESYKRMGLLRDYYFLCGRLFRASESVQWGEFDDIEFSVLLDREISTLSALVRYSEIGAQCDSACLQDIRGTVEEIEVRLRTS